MQNSAIETIPQLPANSHRRVPGLLRSWKAWLTALFASLLTIAVSICIPAYLRWQAIEYLERERIGYQTISDVRTLKKWIGDASRGFVRVSSISRIDPSEQDILVLAAFNELRQLDYSSRTPRLTSAREVEALTSLRNLQSLKLNGLRMSDQDLAGWISSCPELTTIRLVNTGAAVETLQVVSARPSVVNVTIENELTGMEVLNRSSTFAPMEFRQRGPFELKWLQLEGIPIQDDYLADWIASCPQLKHVALVDVGFDIRTLQVVSQLPQLTSLTLQGETLSDDDFAVMDAMPHLEELSLGGPSITGECISHFLGSTDIWVLWMNGTSVSDEGFAQIARIQSLTQLFLCDCRHVRATRIAALGALPNLETVVFTPEMITPEIVESLHHLPALRYVGIVGWPLDEELILSIEEHWIIEWK